MRIVADTNVVVSRFLWHGPERQLMDAARESIVELFTSQDLLAEFDDVLSRPKFSNRLDLRNVSRTFLIDEYSGLATVVARENLSTQISRDKDDDEVLACALAAECEAIVTGDNDLLVLQNYRGIRILRTADLIAELI